ncbi:unnamed protein product [Anisakis simplex]|uniref:Uncharacterized protein n=1 Tax=Anisakis simplex TaxID=6269 RepID=A0A0M3J0G3_ANISI|nr:unnamed protein product [Anisakis simplex]
MEPPPSYEDVIRSDLRNAFLDMERLQYRMPYTIAPPCRAEQNRYATSRGRAPSISLPIGVDGEEGKNHRVITTIVMFVFVFTVIIIIAKLTENSRYATALSPRG